MNANVKKTLCFILIGILFFIGLWLGNLAFFNWWAGGGPPVDYSQLYKNRGNLFGGLSCFSFSLAIFLLMWFVIKSKKKQKR